MKKIKVIKNRSDIGAGTRGSDMGIDAMEVAAINVKNNYFNIFPSIDIETKNESVYQPLKHKFAKRINEINEQCRRLENIVTDTLNADYFPIILTGDHSSATGIIAALKKKYINNRIGIVWIDAHADLNTPYTTPSGNLHGMSLAGSLCIDNDKRTDKNLVDEETVVEWNEYKNLGIKGPKFNAEDLVFFSVRDTEEGEDALMQVFDIKNFTMDEIRRDGVTPCVEKAINKLSNCDKIFVSFDVDSLDSEIVSGGTGTPVKEGLTKDEVTLIIKQLVNTNKVCCFEITEVNPLLDIKGNKMAEVAFEILNEVTQSILKSEN